MDWLGYRFIRFELIGQREREKVSARSDRDVLSLDRVGYRLAFPDLIRLEVPKRLTALGVDRSESSSRLAVENRDYCGQHWQSSLYSQFSIAHQVSDSSPECRNHSQDGSETGNKSEYGP